MKLIAYDNETVFINLNGNDGLAQALLLPTLELACFMRHAQSRLLDIKVLR